MNILLPWNTSYYIPLNAFHPLYKGILFHKTQHRLITPNFQLNRKQYSLISRLYLESAKFEEELWWLTDLSHKDKKTFYNFYDLREINYISYLPGEVEFLHTAPITKGHRPFILHLESFLPFFMPFSFEGKGFKNKENLIKVKKAYVKLIKKSCIAIISHNPKTLEYFSYFFNDKEINNKLKHIPMGIPHSTIKPHKSNKFLTFLYIASAHQNIDNFIYRGGIIALRTAIELTKQNSTKYRFIFRTRKPLKEDLVKHKIDLIKLKELEESGSLIWLEATLHDIGIKRLFASAHFIFLITASLHSDTILNAIMHGTIPIISDIDEYNLYLKPEECIQISGIKNLINRTWNLKYGNINLADYDAFSKSHDIAVRQIVKKLQDLTENDIINLSRNLTNKLNFFNTLGMNKKIFTIFDKINSSNVYNRNRLSQLGEDFITDLTDEYFKVFPQPRTLCKLDFGSIKKIQNNFLFSYKNININFADIKVYSLLSLAKKEFSCEPNNKMKIFNSSSSLASYIYSVYNTENDLLKNKISYLERLLYKLNYKKILIYGAGKHTRRLLTYLKDYNIDCEIVGIIDDNPISDIYYLFNKTIPLMKPGHFFNRSIKYDAIVLSSDIYEDVMWDNLINIGISPNKILRIYK